MSNKTSIWGFGLGMKRHANVDSRKSASVDEEKVKKPNRLPPFNVVLLNDNEHTYEYVVQLLRTVFAYSPERSYDLAKQVDETSRAVVFTTHKELAELKRELIQAYGTDHRVSTCKGSMSAIIEPA